MSVVLVDLDVKRIKEHNTFANTPEIQERFLSLDEYIKIARNTIGAFAHPSLARRMLRDEDAITFVAEYLMRGTIKWEEGKGRTLYSYLNQRAIWAIDRWAKNINMAKKRNPEFSLDHAISKDTDKNKQNDLYSVIEDKSAKPIGSSDPNFDEIIDKPYLNDTQKKCLRMKFVDNMTYREIGAEIGVSGQRIEQIVSAGLVKLRNEFQTV